MTICTMFAQRDVLKDAKTTTNAQMFAENVKKMENALIAMLKYLIYSHAAIQQI